MVPPAMRSIVRRHAPSIAPFANGLAIARPARARRAPHHEGRSYSRRERGGPGVVGIDPVGIGPLLQPGVSARGALHLARALLARRLEAAEGIRDPFPLHAVE